ncbi:MAG: serine dehydratase subunit alpha family protein [Bulleidia sp.]
MKKDDLKYTQYLSILKEELVPAMGCTEPIAIAYASSKAAQLLGQLPDTVVIQASGSIIKNVKSVIVPNTHHLKGMSAAAASGIIAGDPDRQLEVISDVCETQKCAIEQFLKTAVFKEEFLNEGHVFDLIVTLYREEHSASVRITDTHTNIVTMCVDDRVVYENRAEVKTEQKTDHSVLNMKDIYDFAMCVDIDDVREVLHRQIVYNMAIAQEGLEKNYGANIGKVLLKHNENSVQTKAKAYAAAASDARMNGCELPVIINSGSGNQGITCSVPVYVYAREYNVSEETLYRALVLSNLAAIHEKTGIGTLSAFCGAVSAGAGAGAGIAYVLGSDYEGIVHTMVNALAVTSGMICDGAKASCAAKIAQSVDAGIFGYQMYMEGQQFYGGDGIIVKGIENTISNIGRLGKKGMESTNQEIIAMMIE